MAETTQSTSPATTFCPGATKTLSTRPAMGLPSCRGLEASTMGPWKTNTPPESFTCSCCVSSNTEPRWPEAACDCARTLNTTVRCPCCTGPTRSTSARTKNASAPASLAALASAPVSRCGSSWGDRQREKLSPGRAPYQNTSVGRRQRSGPCLASLPMYSAQTAGYMRELMACSGAMGVPHCSDRVAMFCAKSTGASCRPARSFRCRPMFPFSTSDTRAGGKPRCGKPRSPFIRPTTLSGKSSSAASGTAIPVTGSMRSAVVRFFSTRYRARSPTHLEEGVTLTTSPKSMFTSLYASSTALHWSPLRPMAPHCTSRLLY
mmetsp:Transcript_27270/g.60371  ORF Transcript_27270/g.60371 Transcript_27270/m.60371 type:complete len:319 (+) Transcript_27270:320-1276(+)